MSSGVIVPRGRLPGLAADAGRSVGGHASRCRHAGGCVRPQSNRRPVFGLHRRKGEIGVSSRSSISSIINVILFRVATRIHRLFIILNRQRLIYKNRQMPFFA